MRVGVVVRFFCTGTPIAARLSERVCRFVYVPFWWSAACWMGVAFYVLIFFLAGHLLEASMMVAGAWPGNHAYVLTVGAPIWVGLSL